MHYNVLGTTGLKVSPICLGTLNFGSFGNVDPDAAVRVIQSAIDSGINIIDTADEYSLGESEEIVGKALKQVDRSSVVVATKVYSRMSTVDPNMRGGSRRWIMAEVENSLRRLGTDYIDVYQFHRPDEWVDIDDALGAMSDLVRAGKVRYVGSSTFQAHEIVEAQWTAERRGREKLRSEQPPYSLLAREAEYSVLPVAEKYGMGVLTWSPLAGGWLSGRVGDGKVPAPVSSRAAKLFDLGVVANRAKYEAVVELQNLADETGLTLIQLALAFILAHPAVTAPVIGPRTQEQLDSALAALDIRLGADVLDRIDEIVPPGITLNSDDRGWLPRQIADPLLRRRRPDEPGPEHVHRHAVAAVGA
ncbi:aldo/keto reductase [Gordonia sp. DT30]|uniref:aldo/keto reductase n=1 Tax=Gordonia sp. DT30 TaxID=3416546 RepID=UPI003CF9A1EB